MSRNILLLVCLFVLASCIHRLPHENKGNSSATKKEKPRMIIGYYAPYEHAKTAERIIELLENEECVLGKDTGVDGLHLSKYGEFLELTKIWPEDEFLALAHHKKAKMRAYSVMGLKKQNSPYLDSALNILRYDSSKICLQYGCQIFTTTINGFIAEY